MTLKVISIDDSTTIKTHLNYLFKNLEDIEWVGHAFDLEEARKLINRFTPDVILLDIMVEEESGFELLCHVKKNFPNIKVYMLSNLNEDIYIKKSLQMGASYFIDKSYEFETISLLLTKEFKSKKQKLE